MATYTTSSILIELYFQYTIDLFTQILLLYSYAIGLCTETFWSIACIARFSPFFPVTNKILCSFYVPLRICGVLFSCTC